jgi:hypothetical protein
LFKPSPPSGDGRKVSFQNGPPDEIDELYSGSSKTPKQQGSGGKSSKWQPLSAVEPSPVAENDPFSLDDSDDDKEPKAKDNRPGEADRLQTATAEAVAGPIREDTKRGSDTAKGAGTKT